MALAIMLVFAAQATLPTSASDPNRTPGSQWWGQVATLSPARMLPSAPSLEICEVPTDWIVYGMMGPAGFLLVGMALLLSLFVWSMILGSTSTRFGVGPLLIGYACGAFGHLASNFLWSYNEFSKRVSTGLLEEAQRWSIVPGWTVYASVLTLIYLLPPATVVGVPLSAVLLKHGRLTYLSIAATAVMLWLSFAIIAWALPTNEWHRTHRLASFKMIVTDLLPSVALTAVPFLLGIYVTSRSARRRTV